MDYKCIFCKKVKHLDHFTPKTTAYCDKCRCLRSFLLDRSSESPADLYIKFREPAAAQRSIGFARKNDNHKDIVHRPIVPTWLPCMYFKLCLEYMLKLGLSKSLFNRKHNRCYCENCYSVNWNDFCVREGSKYVVPRGWVRFGLYIDDAQAVAENVWSKWIVTFHGTNPQAAKSIIEHHQFLLPGDQCMNGNVIQIRDAHIPKKFQVYTSPTIAYSSLDTYSSPVNFTSTTGKSYKAKLVIQCRQRPGTFKVQPETVGAGSKRICPIIPNSEVEYFTEIRSSIILYGLLIRIIE